MTLSVKVALNPNTTNYDDFVFEREENKVGKSKKNAGLGHYFPFPTMCFTL